MEESQYHLLAHVEDRHWWHLALRRAIQEALEGHGPAGRLRILDVGCGTGGVLASLDRRHSTFGLDLSPLALSYCSRRRLARLTRGTMVELPFVDDSFDVVISIDSLTHLSVDSELDALREQRRVLRPGGLLILQTSAFNWLRGRHDDEVHQKRRFTLREVRRLLEQAGLEPGVARYRLAFMPPLMVINNWLERFRSSDKADMELPRPLLNRLLHRAAVIDLHWGRRLPLGSSVYCLAHKPAGAESTAERRASRVGSTGA